MKKKLLLALVIAAFAGFIVFDLDRYLTLDYLQSQRAALAAYQASHPLTVVAIYFAVYVVVTALSLPGAAVMTLAAGALFGLGWGVLIVSFASSIGATLAFLVARTLLHDWVQRRFAQQLRPINRGIERDGKFYLFTLRLVPLFPFFVINLVMALTPMRTWPFYWVSQIGMLPGTIVYVNAGTQLAQVQSTAGLLSPELILSFVLLGLFPWLARLAVDAYKRWRTLAAFKKPKHFDYNLLVIGAGSAGLVTAYIGATVKAKVGLIERNAMGGDCLNTGCVPSKTLLKSARVAHSAAVAERFGLHPLAPQVDFAAVMDRVQHAVAQVAPHDSVERYSQLGVECLQGEATLVSPWELELDGRRLSARNIVIATGGRPAVPDLPGLEQVDYVTSDSVWQLRERPRRLLVVGGGPIGCELAQAFARLGSEVTMAVRSRLLPKEDEDVAALITQRLRDEGIEVLEGHSVSAFLRDGEKQLAELKTGDSMLQCGFDCVLLAMGRKANTEGLNLDKLGIQLDGDGTLQVDEYLRTSCPTVYACGDVAGPYQFTHVSAHQAWYAAVNALFGGFRRFRVDYRVIPWVTFTDPEVARVGLNEQQAAQLGMAVEVTRYDLAELDRAITESETQGFVKVLTPPGKDRILGVTLVGSHAGEHLSEFVLAMKHNLGLNKILGTIHVYPTFAEANKYAAGEWRKAHKPEKILQWVERYHAWRR